MIQLDVAEYCHGCDGFDPMLENRCYDLNEDVHSQTVVCSNKRLCYQMMRYLERQYKKQEENNGAVQ